MATKILKHDLNIPPILLVGNYPLDGQESMNRFVAVLARNLDERGIENKVICPRPIMVGLMRHYSLAGLPKWLGYFDKYVLFGSEIRRRAAMGWRIHITDHSNSMYARKGRRDVVTCHDLLAVRGALGESTDCPAGPSGRVLQKWILRGLDRAGVICCVSHETAKDVNRLLPHRTGRGVVTVPNGLNYPYGEQTASERMTRLHRWGLDSGKAYLLHVGSNLVRKNKAAILRAVALAGTGYKGDIIFAGPELPTKLRELAQELGLAGRVREIIKPDNADLEALYGGARALLFPSRWEGFGWPIIEAQACGCPVICSDQSALPEVVGHGGLLCPPDDYAAWARSIVEIGRPDKRESLIQAGFKNVAKYSSESMMNGYLKAYGIVV